VGSHGRWKRPCLQTAPDATSMTPSWAVRQVRQAKAILYYNGFRDAAVEVDPELEAGSALPANAEQATDHVGREEAPSEQVRRGPHTRTPP
jgi:hypothetical protein